MIEEETGSSRGRYRLIAIVGILLIGLLISLPIITTLSDNSSRSPAGGTTLPSGVKARIKQIERQASSLRGLKPMRPVRVRFLPNGKFSRKVSSLLNSGYTHRDLMINDQEWVLSGLVPPSTNIQKILTSGLASQVAGWYSYKTKKLYIRDTGQALGIDRWYIAHEYTHALQDQHFNLGKMQPDQTHRKVHNSDSQEAVHSLIEGDAVTIQNEYLARFYSRDEQAALFRQEESIPSPQIPKTLEDSFQFPYTVGPAYVRYLLLAGGYAAVNNAFRHPPRTTYALMFPGQSIRVRTIHLVRVLGPFRRWKTLDDDVNGAFGYQELVELTVSPAQASALAKLWRGDRYVLIRRKSHFAMLMESAYGGPVAAQRAALIIEQSLAARFGGLHTFLGGQWGGDHHLYGAIRLSGSKVWLAYGRSAKLVKDLVVAPTD